MLSRILYKKHFSEAYSVIATIGLMATMSLCFHADSAHAQPEQEQSAELDDRNDADGSAADPSAVGDKATTAEPAEQPVETLAAMIRKSLVVVRATGRDGRDYGHGTGFVISKDGLIATARHVIGDRRAVRIELPDGKLLPVTHVHAVKEAVDLAVLQVDADDLLPLPLGAVAETKAGQPVVTAGYPGSTQSSVFSGLLSGRRDIDGISMLKLSMTVEPGSSGEPVVDHSGRVVGIVTLKSTETGDVGFAVPVDHLQRLLEDPIRMPIRRWMTIGALDPKLWEVIWDANWRQRASRILVDGYGDSFGGRSLCLQTAPPPELPFEVQVEVKLDNENGAAGLAFHADGGDRHYGFYPSAGNARLTRFDGPELNSWKILHNEPASAYRPGEWNTFKVRVEENRIRCYVNEELVVESTDDVIPPGRIGLATFRGTSAGFRRFQFGDSLPSAAPSDDEAARIADILRNVGSNRPASRQTVADLHPFQRFTSRLLEEEAQQLERKARRMRELAADVHAAGVTTRILTALGGNASDTPDGAGQADADQTPDLLQAALLISVLDNDEIEPQAYIDRVSLLADEVRQSIPTDASEQERLAALDRMLFMEYGFRGSRYEYYTRSNSYLNEVIDDREGLPITLSVLYMELARRLDLKVVGLGLPGHYVVRFEPLDKDADTQIIDVFERGKRLSLQQAEQLVQDAGFAVLPQFFQGQTAEAIVNRMLINLLGLAERNRENERVLRYLETLVAINGENPEYRAKRLEIRARTGRLTEAIADVDWFIDEKPDGANIDRLKQLRAELQMQAEAQLNQGQQKE